MTRRPLILSILVVGLAVFAAASWFATRPAAITATATGTLPPEQAEALLRPYSPILGPEQAPVTIVEFFDPACEACRAFYPTVKQIIAEHGAAVRVVLRYTPFHGEGSEEAIRVLEAARMQGVFEPVLQAIMREQPQWPRMELLSQGWSCRSLQVRDSMPMPLEHKCRRLRQRQS